jgi:hypothetical protein
MLYVKAAHLHVGRLRPLRLFVWHDMEWAEATDTAEKCAQEFRTTKTPKSAHICCDNNSVVECVKPEDTAWAAPGANSDGYQIELAGFARQSEAQWRDPFSLASIRQACGSIVPIAKSASIPTRFLTIAQLKDGVTKGHTTHADVTTAFKLSTHTDPGVHFPRDYVLEQMNAALARSDVKVKPMPVKPVVGVPPFPREAGDDMVIKLGDRGREVVAVQTRLRQRGWKIDIDGVFGPGTAEVVEAFSREKHLLALPGVVGPGVWNALWSTKVT